MKKYPKLRYPGEEETRGLFADGTVYVQEKIDGGNGRIMLEHHLDEQFHTDDRDIVFGSRRVVYKNPKDETNQFGDSMEFVRSEVELSSLEHHDSQFDGIVIFGEYMEPHTIQDYNWSKWRGTFIGYDVWSIGGQKFLDPLVALDVIEDIGLPTVPFLDEVSVEDWESGEWTDDTSWCPTSQFGDTLAEGVTIKNPATEVYAKLVREDFKEKNSKTFGKPKKHQESGAEKLSYQYITNARIKKQVHKMIDEGPWDSMQMEMMGPNNDYPGLPELVIRDMAEEEAGNIFMSESWEVDIGDFRSTTSSRCASVLRKMINEREFEELN